MRLLILDQNYPHLDNLMGDVFVHVRAKEYARWHEVKAFSYFQEPSKIDYEGISLERFSDVNLLVDAIIAYQPDKILIHFYQSWMLEKIVKVLNVPVIIWVHGFEALGWYRRLFNFKLYSPVFLNFVLKNTRQQFHFRKLIKYANNTQQVRFVFVSNWMRKITEQDTLLRIKKYDIIPNPIDTKLFQYKNKELSQGKKVLLLRSFDSRKYANDISVEAILKLSKKEVFKQFSFTIIGKGQLFDKTLEPIKNFPNVHIKKGAVRQINIPSVHQEHGIFLCPTRQDAQGVSMCEAMSSGLIPITTNNTAIPEFVSDMKTGCLTMSSQEIADTLIRLNERPGLLQDLSSNAAKSIRELCAIDAVTNKELFLIEN
ncbi:MAG: glycosyltransferase family 4 protein [Ferruginibacter sp.]